MGWVTCQTPKGHDVTYAVRPDTNDAALVGGIVAEDEYHLGDLPPLDGWALDIGAHIGTVAVALAIDHPGLRVLAVEAIPANCDIMLDTIERNGLTDRVIVVAQAASEDPEPVSITYGWSRAENQPDGYMRDSRFIGNMVGANETSTTIACDPVSLKQLLAMGMGWGPPRLLKIDCEGCEWDVLRSPYTRHFPLIIGEYHDDPGFEGLAPLLPEHNVVHLSGTNVGHFRATIR